MIRDFDACDLESVRKLLSSIPEVAHWPADDFLLASQKNFSLRVAEEEGSVCGLIVFRIMTDEAEILNLAVDSSQRRRGTGSRLIQDVIAASNSAGVGKIFLEVRESNGAARKFYARMGFTETGRRRQYYRQPVEDALVLVRGIE
jgi:[ribosomal protein S18]-alanine N-acetyltransferase